jgi:hypothetical protein
MRKNSTIQWVGAKALAAVLCMAWSAGAQADGLADLKSALSRLQGQTPFRALVEAKTWRLQGDEKSKEETHGVAQVMLEDGTRGLSLQYSKDMLGKIETEERNKERDPKAKTPTLSALSEVNSSTLLPMLSAASSMLRSIEKAVFKHEKTDAYNGRTARVLRFELPVERLPEKDRKYIKSYEGMMDIWIAEDGTPLASSSSVRVGARAFMVVSFDSKNEDDTVFGVVGDRLVALKKESRNSASGMGEKGEGKTVKTLQIQS